MSRELAGAIFHGNLTLKLESDQVPAFGYDADTIYFVTTDQKTQQKGTSLYRQSKVVRYRLSNMTLPVQLGGAVLPHRYRIMRSGIERFDKAPLNALYTNPNWWSDYQTELNGSNEKL